MTRSRPITFLASAVVIPLTALTVAACGGGGTATASPAPSTSPSTSTSTSTSAPPAKAAGTQPVRVRVAGSRLGRILVNSNGRTLYLFKADSSTKSACIGPCATAWPPLLATGKPKAGSGLTASKLGTIARPGGKRQVTYNGHPLYLFIKDQKRGQTNGQGVTAFGASWFAVSPAGKQVSSKPARHGVSSLSRSAAPAVPPAAKTQTAPEPAPQPAPQSTPKPAPPVAKAAPPAKSSIPQNNGGDGDSDNNGGPSDGDGNV
jgi:predicted lipoprotein with Yx(FWY)xxD motif